MVMSMNYKFKYDYSKTLWMKLFLAEPDFASNTSKIYATFEQALDIIQKVDNITQGIRKIVYLVGYQGLGHDDCWPEMHIVNDNLKRACDATGRESLIWLMEEAKQYNTIVSLHANVADLVVEDGIFHELAAADAICNDIHGKPAVLQILNGRNCYKTSYKQLWESGIFKRLFDTLCETLPIREAGTLHLDNFCIAESLNPQTYVEEQDEARNKMLDYMYAQGVEITTEYTYREAHFRHESPDHPNRVMYAQAGEDMTPVPVGSVPFRTLGRIPGVWHATDMSIQDCMDSPPSLLSGYPVDSARYGVFCGTTRGEGIWKDIGIDAAKWGPVFIKDFCTNQLPYAYLNRYQRLSYTEDPDAEYAKKYTVQFSDGVVSCSANGSITKNGVVLKQGNDVILPVTEDNETFIAYSENGRSGKWNLPDCPFTEAAVFEITPEGNRFMEKTTVRDGQIELELAPGQGVAIKAAE